MLHVHRSERADALVAALAALLSAPMPDPFVTDVVAVPTRGMERWLSQRLSAVLGSRPGHGDGICANVEFPSPARVVADAVARATGIDPDSDPWLPERAVWPLLDVTREALGEPWLAALATYLGAAETPPDPVKGDRRLTVLRQLAGHLHRYALHRPDMLAAWAAGRDEDAVGRPLPAGAVWQAELWRRLRRRLSVPDPAARVAHACAAIEAAPEQVDLPGRVSVFGLTRLPASTLRVMRALAAGRELHLFLLHPSPGLWEEVARILAGADALQPALFDRRIGASADLVARRAADPTARAGRHRLLASWGRDAREMQAVLLADGAPASDQHHPAAAAAAPETLLARIQDSIRHDRPAPGVPLPGRPDRRPRLHPEDVSLQVHACHGRARQVEVVREAILHAMRQDRTLEPRDVIVMCPDVETFAPLIRATFGVAETVESLEEDDVASPASPAGLASPASPAPAAPAAPERPVDLRVRLADRSLRQTNPLLGLVTAVLELADRRVTASQVLDLADRAPVRRRFRFGDDDLTRLARWVAQSGIRWGLDPAQRAPYRLEAIDNGTWRAGLDRLLLGVAMTEDGDRLFRDVLPLDDVESRAIELAGRLAELVERLSGVLASFERQPLAGWADAIAEAADALGATSDGERWQRAELARILDDLREESDGARPELSVAEIRALLADRLAGRPTRANFRTGHLTVCTLVPMRSVPHRVVCLLGLDDGAFPRRAPRDGDDLLLEDPLVGERDPRSEDRQLLLDALMAAQERLVITYTGNDERTNAPRPPAVPVGELLDLVTATVAGDGGPAADRVLVRHPLQPFDPRNFVPGELLGEAPWSFDGASLAGARAMTGPRRAPGGFLSRALTPLREPVLELADLVRFLEHPVRAFLRRRLGISLRIAPDEIQDTLPVALDGLERWGVGQRLLEARLRGVDGRQAIRAEIARGSLPPGVLGKPVIDDVYPIVDLICAQAAVHGGGTAVGAADPVDVRVDLPDGRRLSGTVAGVSGDVLLTPTFSRVSPRHRLAAWARVLALSAADPQRPFAAATIGRGTRDDDVRIARIAPLAEDPARRGARALEQLTVLTDLYDRGMREPLPIACRASAAYALAVRGGQDGVEAARREWETEWGHDREDRELEHQLAFDGILSIGELLERSPLTGADPEPWDLSDPTRFGRLARRLWDGLLAAEETSAR